MIKYNENVVVTSFFGIFHELFLLKYRIFIFFFPKLFVQEFQTTEKTNCAKSYNILCLVYCRDILYCCIVILYSKDTV